MLPAPHNYYPQYLQTLMLDEKTNQSKKNETIIRSKPLPHEQSNIEPNDNRNGSQEESNAIYNVKRRTILFWIHIVWWGPRSDYLGMLKAHG
jgi:hypothetical protein